MWPELDSLPFAPQLRLVCCAVLCYAVLCSDGPSAVLRRGSPGAPQQLLFTGPSHTRRAHASCGQCQ